MNLLSRALTACLLVAGTVLSAPDAGADDRPADMIAVRTKRSDDKVEIQSQADHAAILIRSPFGISQAVIERTAVQWPTAVVLKLQLSGLEHVRLANGQTTLEAAVGLPDGKPAVRLWKDKAEDAPLDRSSPYWIQVRVLGSDGKPARTIPVKDGVFELTLPKVFFKDNPKSVTVDWIDFYRG